VKSSGFSHIGCPIPISPAYSRDDFPIAGGGRFHAVQAGGTEFRRKWTRPPREGADAVRPRCHRRRKSRDRRQLRGERVLRPRSSTGGKLPLARQRAHVAFQDHIGGEFGPLIVNNERLFRGRFETGFIQKTKYMPKLRFVSAGRPPGTTLSACAFPSFRSNIDEHIANIKSLLKAVRTGSTYSKWRELPVTP
jgi:hypothetical protein